MTPIPKELADEMSNDVFYSRCARSNSSCEGRITWEHAFIYAGKQIQEKWSIIPLCEFHHSVCRFQDGGDLDKEQNQFIALKRASDEELAKYPRKDWKQLKSYLQGKYGA